MNTVVKKFGGYGLLTGLVIFIIHLTFSENFDYSTNEILGYISIFLSLSFIYFGIKHFRDRVNNGLLSLGQALKIGLLIALMVALGIAIADFIYTTFINPEWFANYERLMREQGREDEIMEMTSTLGAVFMFVMVTIIGFIIALISGLILQRK